MLSLAHQFGQGVGEDLGQARHWLRKAAGNGHSEAMYDLAKFLALGIGGKADESESMKWCRASAEQGFATAQARLGAIHVEGEYGVDKNPDEGAKWIFKAAEQEHPEGMHLAGLAYLNGWGVEKDAKKMDEWATRAAEVGHLQAQFNLSVMLIKGEILDEDPVRASRFMEMAARQNHPAAQFNLGMYHFKGSGGKKDLARAYFWFSVAADRHKEAVNFVNHISVDLSPQEILKQMKLANEFKKQFTSGNELKNADTRPKKLFDTK